MLIKGGSDIWWHLDGFPITWCLPTSPKRSKMVSKANSTCLRLHTEGGTCVCLNFGVAFGTPNPACLRNQSASQPSGFHSLHDLPQNRHGFCDWIGSHDCALAWDPGCLHTRQNRVTHYVRANNHNIIIKPHQVWLIFQTDHHNQSQDLFDVCHY